VTRTVLYIEDNADNVFLVECILKRRPELELAVARNGADGLRLARERSPAVILLDRRLPDMLGEDVLAQLKGGDDTAPIPVVMLSGDDPADHAAAVMAGGAADFLPKPFQVDRFLALLDRLSM
jgi:DNA-binding NtrC family response regulator